MLFLEKEVGGIKGWYWAPKDTGAWDGPKRDWETSHRDVLDKYVNRRNVIVQAGGNLGMYPRLLSEMFSHVITCEPDMTNFEYLVQNCADVPNVTKLQVALGDGSKSWVKVKHLTETNLGMHQIEEVAGKTMMITIDNLNLTACDMIWLDIEQYEINALRGAQETIRRFSPSLLVERPTDDVLLFMQHNDYHPTTTSGMDVLFDRK